MVDIQNQYRLTSKSSDMASKIESNNGNMQGKLFQGKEKNSDILLFLIRV